MVLGAPGFEVAIGILSFSGSIHVYRTLSGAGVVTRVLSWGMAGIELGRGGAGTELGVGLV